MEYNLISGKYLKWYISIIDNAKIKNIGNEKHHIVPKSLGGNNNKENLVLLTYREHFLCHWLLIYCYEGIAKAKMVHAFHRMCNTNKNSRYYDIARKLHSEELSRSRKGKNSHFYGKPAWNKVTYVKLICQNCKKKYEVKPSIVGRSKYCSRKCHMKGRNYFGENNPCYRGGTSRNYLSRAQ